MLVVMGGRLDTLKMVHQAMENEIPVVIVQGSGGVAELFHRVHSSKYDA